MVGVVVVREGEGGVGRRMVNGEKVWEMVVERKKGVGVVVGE